MKLDLTAPSLLKRRSNKDDTKITVRPSPLSSLKKRVTIRSPTSTDVHSFSASSVSTLFLPGQVHSPPGTSGGNGNGGGYDSKPGLTLAQAQLVDMGRQDKPLPALPGKETKAQAAEAATPPPSGGGAKPSGTEQQQEQSESSPGGAQGQGKWNMPSGMVVVVSVVMGVVLVGLTMWTAVRRGKKRRQREEREKWGQMRY